MESFTLNQAHYLRHVHMLIYIETLRSIHIQTAETEPCDMRKNGRRIENIRKTCFFTAASCAHDGSYRHPHDIAWEWVITLHILSSPIFRMFSSFTWLSFSGLYVLHTKHTILANFYIELHARNIFFVCEQGDWVYPYRPGDYATLTRKYLGSLYWSTLTLTTIGDLPTPETNAE